jgi:hypothetical protein
MINYKTKFLGLALAGLILGACSQTGTYETADLMNEQAAAEKGGAKLTPFGNGNENAMVLTGGGDYLTDCITDESGDAFKATGDLSETFGGGPNASTQTLDAEVWNTLTTIEYRFILTSNAQNGGNLQYLDEESGDWINEGALTIGETFSVSRPLPDGWKAGDVITEQWRRTGGGGTLGGDGDDILDNGVMSYALIGICTTTTISDGTIEPICENAEFSITGTVSSFGDFEGGVIQIRDEFDVVVASADVTDTNKEVTYDVPTGTAGTYTFTAHYVGAGSNGYNDSNSDPISVEVEECVGCDESFSYVDNGDNEAYVFTYIPAEDVSGAILVFTFAQGVAESATGLNGWATNGSTRQITMDLVACQEYTWTVDLTPDCSGSSANSNVWTDFKVDDISKKNSETPTITESCPS